MLGYSLTAIKLRVYIFIINVLHVGWMSLGTWKHTSSIFTSFFVRHQYCSNSYVACYAPIATALMTNKNPAQILDAYLFPSALPSVA